MTHTATSPPLHERGCKVRKQPTILRPLGEYLYYPSNRDALGEFLAQHTSEQLLAVGADPGVIEEGFPSVGAKLRARDSFVIVESDKLERNCVKPIGMVAISPVLERRSILHKKRDNRLISAWVDTNALEPCNGRLTFSGFAYNVVSTAVDLARHKGADAVCMVDRSCTAVDTAQSSLRALDRIVADPMVLEFESMGVGTLISDGRLYIGERWSRELT
ncbi:MAG: hypothetical protein QG659_153 [Patescibacteria group bacterium]|nr:hypothetical protein [Patescibacteria group bacterium]